MSRPQLAPTSKTSLLILTAGLALLAACRGQESDSPPVHLNPNMDSQPRYDPQSEAKFFEDRRTMRTPVDGTIAKGNENDNEAYVYGHEGDKYVVKMPVPITAELLERGQERYNIYCTPCHAQSGNGAGIVVKRGYPAAANLQEKYSRTMTDGQIYAAIAAGVRNMPSYAGQIPVADRWAIVAYVRALQFSQNASLDDVPTDKRGSLTVDQTP